MMYIFDTIQADHNDDGDRNNDEQVETYTATVREQHNTGELDTGAQRKDKESRDYVHLLGEHETEVKTYLYTLRFLSNVSTVIYIVLFLMICIDNSDTGRKEENKKCIIVRSDFLYYTLTKNWKSR